MRETLARRRAVITVLSVADLTARYGVPFFDLSARLRRRHCGSANISTVAGHPFVVSRGQFQNGAPLSIQPNPQREESAR
jgi:hypothetical protein